MTDNISQSSSLPADFYFDATIWEQMKESVFAKNWQYIGKAPSNESKRF